MSSNKTLHQVVTELLIRGRELNVSFAFITQSNFQLLNTRHFFLMRIPNKWQLQQIIINHLYDIGFNELHCKDIFIFGH